MIDPIDAHEVEDAHHFISVCPVLTADRSRLLNSAPDIVKVNLPDPSVMAAQLTRMVSHVEATSIYLSF